MGSIACCGQKETKSKRETTSNVTLLPENHLSFKISDANSNQKYRIKWLNREIKIEQTICIILFELEKSSIMLRRIQEQNNTNQSVVPDVQ